MRPSFRLALFLSGAFLLGVASGRTVSLQDSFAQGYEGLIAPGNSGGGGAEQQQGYRGLIPGQVPEEPPRQAAPAPQQPPAQQQAQTPAPYTAAPAATRRPLQTINRDQFAPRGYSRPRAADSTTEPGYKPPSRIRTLDDIKSAMQAPKDIDWKKGLPPQLESQLKGLFTPHQRAMLATPRMRMDGMLPAEFVAKRKIDQIMGFVRDPALTDEQRKANARKASEKLKELAYGYQYNADIPDLVYKTMGLPEVYVREERESARNSLNRAEAALQELRKYH